MQSTAFLTSENSILKQMALQGQTVFAASGDAGAYSDQSKLSVIDPASQPFVVAVGGTRLMTQGGTYDDETTWNNGSPSQGAGGGGVSALWVQPSWQSGVGTSSNRGSSSMRNVPDVSLNADPMTGYSIFVGGRWVNVGGTSAAAPLWAGFMALVNHQRMTNGLGPVGFLNPRLYSIGRSARYSADFNDIQDGSTNLYYPAVPGFDDATGWGTLNGQGLLEDLGTDSADTSAAISC
jgi:kumamolisin